MKWLGVTGTTQRRGAAVVVRPWKRRRSHGQHAGGRKNEDSDDTRSQYPVNVTDMCQLGEQPLSSRVSKCSPDALTCALQQDLNVTSVTTMLLWHQLVEAVCDVRISRELCDTLRRDWEADACLRVRESIFTEITTQPHLQMKKDSANVYEKAAANLRKDESFLLPRQALGAEDEQLFGRRADLPICFAIRHANNRERI